MGAIISALGYSDLHRLMDLQLGDEKHAMSATSTLDVIWVLYDRILRVDRERPDDPDRDRFLLSKGHGPMAYYAVLAAKGFIDSEILSTFGRFDSPLGHHPDRNLVPGVEISSGSLGHGLGIAVGMALGLRARGSTARVFCLVGDAELDEGSNHEAIAFAGRAGLDGLTCVAVDNQSSSHGWPGGIAARFALEGWSTATVNGRDRASLERAFNAEHAGRPHAVVAVVERKP
jgi:transketolase